MLNPTLFYLKGITKVVQYLKGTAKIGIIYRKDYKHQYNILGQVIGEFSLYRAVDADFATNLNDYTLVSRYVFFIASRPIL